MNIHVSLSISGHVMSALVFIICSTQANGVFELGRGHLTLHVVKILIHFFCGRGNFIS